MGTVEQTISPSMDIQVSSNFERFLFDLYGRDGNVLTAAMAEFRRDGTLAVGDNLHRMAQEAISASRLGDAGTLQEMKQVLKSTGELIDPHTAIGVAAGRAMARENSAPIVAQAAAHPAKFPDAVEQATGRRPALPPHLSDLYERTERFDVLPNDLTTMQDHIRRRVSLLGAA